MSFKEPKRIFYYFYTIYIRVLPDRVKRGYAFERAEKYILHHIRVLPDRVKRGYAFNFKEPKRIFYTISAFYPIG